MANPRVVIILYILLGINVSTFCMFIFFFRFRKSIGTCNAEGRDFFFFVVVFTLQTIIFSRFIKFSRCLKALKIFKALPLNSTKTTLYRDGEPLLSRKKYIYNSFFFFLFVIHELHFIWVISNVRGHDNIVYSLTLTQWTLLKVI